MQIKVQYVRGEDVLVTFPCVDIENLGNLIDTFALAESGGHFVIGYDSDPSIEVGRATTYNVVLTSAGKTKIQLIKEHRHLTGLGLKESKEWVDGVGTSHPGLLAECVPSAEAQRLKEVFEGVGGVVKLEEVV